MGYPIKDMKSCQQFALNTDISRGLQLIQITKECNHFWKKNTLLYS